MQQHSCSSLKMYRTVASAAAYSIHVLQGEIPVLYIHVTGKGRYEYTGRVQRTWAKCRAAYGPITIP